MQHKRHHRSRKRLFLIILAVLVVAGVVTLSVVDVPAPQKPVEKQLDAKAFLGAQ